MTKRVIRLYISNILYMSMGMMKAPCVSNQHRPRKPSETRTLLFVVYESKREEIHPGFRKPRDLLES